MSQFPILALPSEVQPLVVQRVANNSFADLYRLQSTCKSMLALADQRGVYGSFDLFKYPWHVGRRNLLLRRCYTEGNPSCIYIKGVEYIYGLDREKEGLGLLKRAADAGYERALYTYAMTRKIFWEDEEYFSRFTRKSVGRIGMVVRDEDLVWLNNDNERFIAKRNLFMSTVVPLFYSCPCSPCLDQDWVLWYIECGKAGDMCNRCFWIKEDLIKIAHEGLKEDICEGLESEEFATLQALFLEAAAVERKLEMENSPEEKPRRRKKRKNSLLDPEDELPWDKPQPEEEEESEDEESDDDWSYEGDTRVEVEYDDMGFSTPGSVSAVSGTVTDESESLTATNSTADGDSVADSSVSVADSVADNSAAGLGFISGSNLTGVGSVSGNVADSSPSAAGSSRISNSVAFSGAGKCSATSVVSNL
ncbi:unnamed protein product [Brassica oleracea]|uniref:At2g35280-like TPR domain-containing protein n=1 Tax=Brassica oleracea TaxID=3712 RepID=A0A3P6G1F4_BRAOL|nr:unnamed protein product [Brassica oleracea]